MDDLRFGRVVRALRHRLGLRQSDIAARAGTSQDLISRLERGRFEGLTIRFLRRVLAVFDAELVISIRWRGGELDRLVDRDHAALAEAVSALLRPAGWEVAAEVSYSEYGERGSIDLLAWHAGTRTLLVIELKTELTSIEETLRKHDAKTRLAAKIAAERLGWRPNRVGRLLVLPDERTPRRHVERHATLFARLYPLRGWPLRRWLSAPGAAAPVEPAPEGSQVLGGLLYLSPTSGVRTGRGPGGRRRVSRRMARQSGVSDAGGC